MGWGQIRLWIIAVLQSGVLESWLSLDEALYLIKVSLLIREMVISRL